MRHITPELAAACWQAIKDAPEAEEEHAMVHRPEYVGPECAIRIRGWVLVPFIDGGDWDYVNSIVSPDGQEYEIQVTSDDNGYLDTPENHIFNWYPKSTRTGPCCRGYLPGRCW